MNRSSEERLTEDGASPAGLAPASSNASEAGEALDPPRMDLMLVAATLLTQSPFATVTMKDIAVASGTPQASIEILFEDMHALGAAILDHERASMHAVQSRLSRDPSHALEKLVLAFRLVGENLASDVIVRAGVRLAAESREHFPERRLDPFRTWEMFVTAQLVAARDAGLLKKPVDIAETVRVFVAVGMGTKDLLAFRDDWDHSAARLDAAARSIVDLIRV